MKRGDRFERLDGYRRALSWSALLAKLARRPASAVHHLALRTPDVDRLLAFYRAWFGLSLVRDARPRSVWFALAPGAVLMIERSEAGEPAIPSGSRELIAFAVTPARRARLRERLLRAGELEGETEHTLYFRDPDGRRVAVSSHPLSGGTRSPCAAK